jgi:hypothetical protein
MKRTHCLGVLVLAALAAPLLIDLLWQSDEEAIQELFRELAVAAEARDADAMLSRLSADFSVAPEVRGYRSPEDLRRFLEEVEELRVEIVSLEVQVEGYRAESALTCFVLLRTSGMRGGLDLKASCELRRAPEGGFEVHHLQSLRWQ